MTTDNTHIEYALEQHRKFGGWRELGTPEQERYRKIVLLKERTLHFDRVLIDEKWDRSYVKGAFPRKQAHCARTGTTMGSIFTNKDGKGYNFHPELSIYRSDSFCRETAIMLPDLYGQSSMAAIADRLNEILAEWEKNNAKN